MQDWSGNKKSRICNKRRQQPQPASPRRLGLLRNRPASRSGTNKTGTVQPRNIGASLRGGGILKR